ncbi:hypothetical protein JCM8097_002620 [Rhodosporidiobolus ruineniae]
MLLTLVPPASYPIPVTLQTHDIPQPSFPAGLKVPLAWLRSRRALQKLGLNLPHSSLAADKTIWWHFAVVEVTWDLEDELLLVRFADGTEDRWELGADDDTVKSSEFVTDSLDEEAAKPEREEKDRVDSPATVSPRRPRPWAPSTVLAKLQRLSVELRSAYEDLSTSAAHNPRAPDISTEGDFRELMLLSANPSRKVPFEWSSAQTYYEYAMDGVDGGEDDRETSAGPSQVGGEVESTTSSKSTPDPFWSSGEFRSVRRPRRLAPDRSSRSAPTTHDYLSLVHLLTRVREYLADLFAATVIPKLRDSLPPTYALWLADSAIVWCRRQAVDKSAEAAQLVLELVEDDADDLEASEPEREPDIAVFDPDSDFDGDAVSLVGSLAGGGGGGVMDDSGIAWLGSDDSGGGELLDRYSYWLDERRQKRLSDNPLRSLKDDFQLRCWAEGALERRREAQRDEWTSGPNRPQWVRAPEEWEVSRSVEGDSDLDEPAREVGGLVRGRKGGRGGGVRVPLAFKPKTVTTPPTSPPGDETGSSSRGFFDVPGLDLPSSIGGGDSDDDDDDADLDADGDVEMDDPPSLLSLRRYSPEYFYPEDLVGEAFLPKRLSREVVEVRRDRGKTMERMRAKLHEKLNQVAGLQKKIYELQGFVKEESARWEVAKEVERDEKESLPPGPSGLRNLGPSSATVPAPSPSLSILPLKAQPLNRQTADKALSSTLRGALHAIEPSKETREATLRKLPSSPPRLRSPAPRRRQQLNLVALDDVATLQAHGYKPAAPKKRKRSSIDEKGKKKRSKSSGSGGGEKSKHWGPTVALASIRMSAGAASPTKRGRKAFKPVKREDAVIFARPDPSSSSGAVVPVPSAPAASAPAPAPAPELDGRHLAVLELSNRRRSGLEAAAEPPASLDWIDDDELHEAQEEEDEEDNVHVPWAKADPEDEVDAGEVEEDSEMDDPDLDDPTLLMEEELELLGEEDVDDELPRKKQPAWGVFPPRTTQASSSKPVELIVRPPSTFPRVSLQPPPSSAVPPVAAPYPVSSERRSPLHPPFILNPLPTHPSSSTSPPLLAPQPVRASALFSPRPAPLTPPPRSPSSTPSSTLSPSSPTSSQQSLAQRMRESLAVAGTSPPTSPTKMGESGGMGGGGGEEAGGDSGQDGEVAE